MGGGHLYAGAIPTPVHLHGLAEANPMPLLDPACGGITSARPTMWGPDELLPVEARGLMAPMTPQIEARLKALLVRPLSR